ncbi:MAG TPA: decaprenyl-phosphate phosphoribosyltransferase [Bacteroidia bacterium]|jgi:decaprenyl-phosphate phosphoribosyltransferase|nr:decaprenyl-phosphate phosphoribosyltransferase [Bacteroidia bacterium]
MKYLQLIRVQQWLKNFFIFAPLFFSGHLFDVDKLIQCALAFLAFSLNASSIYIINDYKDIEKDRLHHVKKLRPLAAGTVTKATALSLFCFLAIVSFALAYYIHLNFAIVIGVYFVMNLLYSFGLKKISLVDIFIISIGFVLRVTAGGVVAGIEISHWLYIMTFLIALFIAFAKRRDDVLLEMETGEKMRKSISGYNIEFISSALSILCGILVVSYLLYITSPEITLRFQNKHAYISTVFVIMGILRYLQITLVEGNSGSPTKLFIKDRFLQIAVILWMLFFAAIIYTK